MNKLLNKTINIILRKYNGKNFHHPSIDELEKLDKQQLLEIIKEYQSVVSIAYGECRSIPTYLLDNENHKIFSSSRLVISYIGNMKEQIQDIISKGKNHVL
jgi:sugar phosphate permease